MDQSQEPLSPPESPGLSLSAPLFSGEQIHELNNFFTDTVGNYVLELGGVQKTKNGGTFTEWKDVELEKGEHQVKIASIQDEDIYFRIISGSADPDVYRFRPSAMKSTVDFSKIENEYNGSNKIMYLTMGADGKVDNFTLESNKKRKREGVSENLRLVEDSSASPTWDKGREMGRLRPNPPTRDVGR